MQHHELAMPYPFISRRHFSAQSLLYDNNCKLFIFIDFIIILCAYQLGVMLSPFHAVIFGSIEFWLLSISHGLSVVTINLGLGYYIFSRRFRLSNIFVNSLLAHSIAIMLSVSIAYFGFYAVFSRLGIVYGAAASYLLTCFVKLLMRWYVLRHPYRVGLCGKSLLIDKVKQQCQSYRLSFRCEELDVDINDTEKTLSILKQRGIRALVCSNELSQAEAFVELSIKGSAQGLTMIHEVEFYTYLFEHIPIDQVNKRWLVHMGLSQQPSQFFLISKRIIDFSFSLFCLLIASPIMLLIALLIKATSSGPVFFVQKRMGRYSKPFNIYKFRTMYNNNNGAEVTSAQDDRVTSLGKILRPLHLDELPQLLNILKGDMAFVGARPETVAYAEKMQKVLPSYQLRDLYRPGITGLAQLSMPYPMHVLKDTKKKIGYDFYYLINQCLLLDIKIICFTFFMVLFPPLYRQMSRH